MTVIKLVDYTNSKKKIPSTYLSPAEIKKPKSYLSRPMLGMYCDFFLACMISMAFKFHMDSYVNSFLEDSAYYLKFKSNILISLSCFSFILFSINFIGIFFNHGQTFGMKIVKLRFSIRDKNLHDVLKLSLIYLLCTLSMGLALAKRKINILFQDEDYLYQKLISEKLFSKLDLVSMSNKEIIEAANYKNAA
jgi:hypothetical protein